MRRQPEGRRARGRAGSGLPGARTQDGQPRRAAGDGEEAGDLCRHPGPPGSPATLMVLWELMASDVLGSTAPSPFGQAGLGQEVPPTAHLWAFLSRPLEPLLFPLPPGARRAGARLTGQDRDVALAGIPGGNTTPLRRLQIRTFLSAS